MESVRLGSFVMGNRTGYDVLSGLCCVGQSGCGCVIVRDFSQVHD